MRKKARFIALAAALVCTANAFDDFLVLKRTRKFDSRTIGEGAGALVLVRDQAAEALGDRSTPAMTDWSTKIKADPHVTYGIASQIIDLLSKY